MTMLIIGLGKKADCICCKRDSIISISIYIYIYIYLTLESRYSLNLMFYICVWPPCVLTLCHQHSPTPMLKWCFQDIIVVVVSLIIVIAVFGSLHHLLPSSTITIAHHHDPNHLHLYNFSYLPGSLSKAMFYVIIIFVVVDLICHLSLSLSIWSMVIDVDKYIIDL